MKEIEKRLSALESTILTLLKHIQEVNSSIVNGFEKVNKNFTVVNGRLDAVNGKIDALRGNSTASMETVENKLADLTVEISKSMRLRAMKEFSITH